MPSGWGAHVLVQHLFVRFFQSYCRWETSKPTVRRCKYSMRFTSNWTIVLLRRIRSGRQNSISFPVHSFLKFLGRDSLAKVYFIVTVYIISSKWALQCSVRVTVLVWKILTSQRRVLYLSNSFIAILFPSDMSVLGKINTRETNYLPGNRQILFQFLVLQDPFPSYRLL